MLMRNVFITLALMWWALEVAYFVPHAPVAVVLNLIAAAILAVTAWRIWTRTTR